MKQEEGDGVGPSKMKDHRTETLPMEDPFCILIFQYN